MTENKRIGSRKRPFLERTYVKLQIKRLQIMRAACILFSSTFQQFQKGPNWNDLAFKKAEWQLWKKLSAKKTPVNSSQVSNGRRGASIFTPKNTRNIFYGYPLLCLFHSLSLTHRYSLFHSLPLFHCLSLPICYSHTLSLSDPISLTYSHIISLTHFLTLSLSFSFIRSGLLLNFLLLHFWDKNVFFFRFRWHLLVFLKAIISRTLMFWKGFCMSQLFT